MNWYFYRVWIPLQTFTLIGIAGILTGDIVVNWWLVFICFFFIGPVGIGVGFHRLFSHRAFETWKPIERMLAILGTLSAYAPVMFWVSNHQYHHQYSDYEEDPSSPLQHGIWESFFAYRMRDSVLKKVDLRNGPMRTLLKDKFLVGISKNFATVLWCYVALLVVLGGPSLVVSAFLLPAALEHLRTNIVSCFSHLNFPFSYRNHITDDASYNNLILGYLTFGFGWHNNHHHDQKAISNRERWWEVDIEGLIARLLEKKTWKHPN